MADPPGKYIYVHPGGNLTTTTIGDFPPGANVPVFVVHVPYEPGEGDGNGGGGGLPSSSSVGAGFGMFQGLADLIADIIDRITNLDDTVKEMYDGVVHFVGNGVDRITDYVGDAWDTVASSVSEGFDNVTAWIGDTASDVANFVGDGLENVGEWLTEAKDTIVDFTRDSYENVKAAVSSGLDFVGDTINDGLDAASGILEDIRYGLSSGFDTLTSDLGDFTGQIGANISSAVASFTASAEEQKDAIVGTLTAFPEALSALASTAPNSAIDFILKRLEVIAEIPARVFFNMIRDALFEEVT